MDVSELIGRTHTTDTPSGDILIKEPTNGSNGSFKLGSQKCPKQGDTKIKSLIKLRSQRF